ncbi:MAG: fructose-specific PTS transporter subunit EIIC [Terrisporobacter sp.]|uniref:PTS fructose transporter subunit IIABC n=2 Tax=Terrisporobacter sp. TaxID=1965305 RepID=UPI002A3F441E|nr:fructose-specific PTS transporter subunit EIIC [Terrisporobacter sp.]MCI5628964.1 fructose-specific PTS transporter subunit EIIC [Clostridium sp.]MDD5879589.1 fructose-specific PTS transporter subunit EIIC [Clostridiales bacterium]MDY6153343.1 fructose-specific PTS transporter subunit EIIC [Terrisporobacter sp.]
MRIVDLINKNSVKLDLNTKSKLDVVDELVDLVNDSGNLNDKNEYKKAILAREKLGTTAIGEGVAIPHAKNKSVNKACLAAGVSKEGIDYEAFDDSLSHLFFMIAAPDGANDTHLEVLSRLSTILMDESFRNDLMNSPSVEEFLDLIDEKEKEKFPEEEVEEETDTKSDLPTVLAVTACPTGIAHTFMAAENLSQKADAKGISIKVETNGSAGIKNALTKEEIEHATCIIVAADKNVEMARFNGKKVIITKVADGIHKADELIDRAIKGDAPIYHASEDNSSNEVSNEKEGIGRQFYKHLMNGVSHMLPFVVGGGILIALAFLLDDYTINPANFGMNTPVAAFFKTIGGQAFGFMLPVLAGYIAMSIADRPGLAVGFVGGVLASSGYTFGNIMNFADASPVSAGFLGALLAGFVGGYLVLGLKKVFNVLPDALEGIKPVLLYPVCGILLIGLIMLAVNPVVGAINTGLNNFLASMSGTSKIILGTILGAMMAIDMGGPFNKAAYVFGTAQLTVVNAGPEQFAIMAAVMIGGMVPPIAIALATTFFKNRFTESERKSGVVNYIMGLSFITEGAIPFAAADPIHVIPACIVGSGIAGALSMAFGCGLRAPHGGIFVLPTISNPIMYFVALLIGSVVGALLIGVLKKPLDKIK